MSGIKFNETADYRYIRVLGIDGVYTPANIKADDLPAGFHKYNMLPGDNAMFSAVSIQDNPNAVGSLITKEKLEFGNEGYLDEEDWVFSDRGFDFESHFGCKLAFDTQVELAEAKRDAMAAEKELAKTRGNSHPREEHDNDL